MEYNNIPCKNNLNLSQYEGFTRRRIVNIKLLGKAANWIAETTNIDLFLQNSWEILEPKKANSSKKLLILKTIQPKLLDCNIIQPQNFS